MKSNFFATDFNPKVKLATINDNLRAELATTEDATQQLDIQFKAINLKLDLLLEMDRRVARKYGE